MKKVAKGSKEQENAGHAHEKRAHGSVKKIKEGGDASYGKLNASMRGKGGTGSKGR